MRKLFTTLAVGAALLGATAAQAGPLVYAQLTFLLGTLPPAAFTASGLLGGAAAGTGRRLPSGHRSGLDRPCSREA